MYTTYIEIKFSEFKVLYSYLYLQHNIMQNMKGFTFELILKPFREMRKVIIFIQFE